jgi:hypothetical protein
MVDATRAELQAFFELDAVPTMRRPTGRPCEAPREDSNSST